MYVMYGILYRDSKELKKSRLAIIKGLVLQPLVLVVACYIFSVIFWRIL